jgi:hypothetical protein
MAVVTLFVMIAESVEKIALCVETGTGIARVLLLFLPPKMQQCPPKTKTHPPKPQQVGLKWRPHPVLSKVLTTH